MDTYEWAMSLRNPHTWEDGYDIGLRRLADADRGLTHDESDRLALLDMEARIDGKVRP